MSQPVSSSPLPRVTRRAQSRLGVWMTAPLALVLTLFFLIPFGSAIYYSFVDFDGVDESPPYVGLKNYTRMFTDEKMWYALKHNAIWILLGTAVPIVLGLVIALLLWSVKQKSVLYQAAFFAPCVLPGVAVAIIWSWIYDPSQGWINVALRALGLGSFAQGWLGDPRTVLYALLATAIWASFGFGVVIFLSALRNVDEELVDAARLDRANAFQRVWHVILPQISSVFVTVMMITLVGGFSVFDIIFVMTGGGPNNASSVLGTYAFENAFQLNEISYGTTLALFITALSVPCALILNRIQGKLADGGRR